jgi:S-adenosylmethionine:tRNA ribosyltransferase-isomerase
VRIADFRYELPDERIAKFPLQERDASKLLIYQEGKIQEDIYKNLSTHIPSNSLLVFNQTKVIHARLLFQKETGGTIEVFCLEPHKDFGDVSTAMLCKEKVWWKCMIGGASKWKHGQVLSQNFSEQNLQLTATIVERETGSFTLELKWNNQLSFAEVLHIAGKVPLPPYLIRNAEATDEERYQTIYARNEGSVAAPTAGLHFTHDVMQSLTTKNIATDFVTLHVGAGTFKPVKSETMEEHEMHAEWIDVSIEFIENLLTHLEKGIIAVGTTSLRTIESLYWIGCKIEKGIAVDFSTIALHQWEAYEIEKPVSPKESLTALLHFLQEKKMDRLVTRTQIIIAPKYDFKIVTALITNFHQPESTLLLLVAALIGNDWRSVYEYALQHNFRFLSYGDGSLLWAKK